ncbi:polysaccharide deacetylase family protein [Syntrophaceticus schinkii]|uniref:Polysaccharide deacetylase n=1 Tax=Syntrophaceticus schinkii TaxID=499207 RepID=A0A0B7MD88_9FIRM|nr:polysaccharide deacetylase family protein [Syntrophaceticus schinkii]CEO88529.1 Polysaccharide deacetylase [Syntrophaceticus schinkii]
MKIILLRYRRLLIWGACFIFLAGVFVLSGLYNQVSGVFNSGKREVPIYAVDMKEKKLAISFDAAWGADCTPTLLKILKENNIKTTFFLTGIWVKEYPEMVKAIADAGHELGNHSLTHPHCNTLSEEEFIKELKDNEEMIYKLTKKRTRLFRPPFGEYDNNNIKAARKNGYEVIQWSVDSLDWQELGTEAVVDRILKNAHPGAIMLFHNNAKYTPEALPIILKKLKEDGYKIVPVSDLLIKGDYYVERHSGIQKKAAGSN